MAALLWVVVAPLAVGGLLGWASVVSPRFSVAVDVAFLVVFGVLVVANVVAGDPLMTALAALPGGCYVYSLRDDLRQLRATRGGV